MWYSGISKSYETNFWSVSQPEVHDGIVVGLQMELELQPLIMIMTEMPN